MTAYTDSSKNPNAAGPVWIAGPPPGSATTALYLNAQTLVKPAPGTVMQVNVIVAGAAGAIYDTASTGSMITANEVAVVPATVGPLVLNFPCLTGIVYNPGSGQAVSISYW